MTPERITELASVGLTPEDCELTPFDVADFLETADDAIEYLKIVLEENDQAALLTALGDIARSKGMAEIAARTGLGRESLYKSLRADAQPRFDTIVRIINALGYKLTLVPH